MEESGGNPVTLPPPGTAEWFLPPAGRLQVALAEGECWASDAGLPPLSYRRFFRFFGGFGGGLVAATSSGVGAAGAGISLAAA